MQEYKILIIEDDINIAEAIVRHFEKWDYIASYVTDFKSITKEVVDKQPSLILLDIQLPYFNGFYWCQEIRKFSKVPIIFISSASDDMNIIMAMDVGADDFIVKPFELPVLTAKVGALLRRTYSYKGNSQMLEHKGVFLNLSDGIVKCNDKEVELSKNEMKILRMLMENGGEMLSRDAIMLQLWEGEDFVDDNTLTVNITRIRKKLSDIGIEDYIKTKKGIGYFV